MKGNGKKIKCMEKVYFKDQTKNGQNNHRLAILRMVNKFEFSELIK